jgi:ribosomal protein S18 acetylase RimI-like enzyme
MNQAPDKFEINGFSSFAVTFKFSTRLVCFEARARPRVFSAHVGNEEVGWIELGYERWNNRMRVWELLVAEECRKQGIGTLLMNHAVLIARQKGARMLVLETQTNNATAIDFYLRFGFDLIGLDTAAYSNEDVAKREVRLEMGMKL